jgi:hypothetical protein
VPTPVVSLRRALPRAGVVSLAANAATSLGLGSASAAPGLLIPLAPEELFAVLLPVENFGVTDLLTGSAGEELFLIPAAWAGTVDVQLPPGFAGSAGDVSLSLAPDLESDPDRTYTSDDLIDPLAVTAVGDGELRVTLPVDDGSTGPIGLLTFEGITSDVEGVMTNETLDYVLDLDAAASAPVELVPQVIAFATVPCPLSSIDPCPPYVAEAGSSITVSVPAGSLLQQVGLGTLENAAVVIEPVDADGAPIGAGPIELTGGAALAAAAAPGAEEPAGEPAASQIAEAQELASTVSSVLDAGTALPVAAASPGTEPSISVTLPAELAAGDYMLSIVEGGTAVGFSATYSMLTVPAAPVPVVEPASVPAPAPAPAQNAGLQSDTGWIEPAADADGTSPLVLLGGGAVLAATVGALVVLRPRRRGASGQ